MTLSILTLAFIDWMQFGLAGATFATLAGMTMKILKLLKDKSSSNDTIVKEMRQEMWAEIEKRDLRFVDLQEKTLKALYKMASALERLAIAQQKDDDETPKNESNQN